MDLVILVALIVLTAAFGRAFSRIGVDVGALTLYITEIAILLCGAAACARLGWRGALDAVRPLPLVSLLVFWLVGAVATARGLLGPGLEDTLHDVGLAEYAVFMPLVALVATTRRRQEWIWWALVAGGIGATVVFAATEVLGRGFDIETFLADQEGQLAGAGLYVSLFVIAAAASLAAGVRLTPAVAMLAAAALILIVLTDKRSAWAAALLGLLTAGLLAPRGRRVVSTALALIAFVAAGVVAFGVQTVVGEGEDSESAQAGGAVPAVVMTANGGSQIADELSGLAGGNTAEGENMSWRWAYWKELVQRSADRPLIGVGFGEPTKFVWNGHRYDFRDQNPENWSDVTGPHNGFIDALYRLGLVGFLALITIVGLAAFRLFRFLRSNSDNDDRRLLVVSTAAMFVSSAVFASLNEALNNPYLALFFWATLALVLVLTGTVGAGADEETAAATSAGASSGAAHGPGPAAHSANKVSQRGAVGPPPRSRRSASSRRDSWRGALALVAVVLVAVALHVDRIASKETFTYDEPSTYLTSTCHAHDYWQRIWAEDPPFGKRVEARDLQRYMLTQGGGEQGEICPGVISQSLGLYSIHPPLYFWALNGWVAAFGVDIAAAPRLNVIFAVFTMLALAGLAFHLFGSWFAAVFVAFVWGVSPAGIELTAEARMYALFPLVGILFVWQAVRFSDSAREHRRRELALLGATALVAALTHYHFLLVVIAGLMLITWRTWPEWTRPAAGGAAIAAGLILSYVVHPYFFASLEGSQPTGGIGPSEFWGLADRTFASLGSLIVGPDVAGQTGVEYIVAVLVVVIALASVVYCAWRRDRTSPAAIPALFALIVTPMILLYVSGRSPGAAMGLKYLAVALPFLLFAPLVLMSGLGRGMRRALAVFVAAVFLVLGLITARDSGPWEDDTGNYRLLPAQTVAGSDLLVIDSSAWNMVARAVWNLPPDQPVLVASQEYLADSRQWVDLIEPDTAYLAILALSQTEELQRQIARSISVAAGSPLRSVEQGVVFGELLRTGAHKQSG